MGRKQRRGRTGRGGGGGSRGGLGGGARRARLLRRRPVRIALIVVITLIASVMILARTGVTKLLMVPVLESALGVEVEVDRARIGPTGRVVLEGFRAVVPGVDGPAGRFVEVERVTLELRPGALGSGAGAVRRVELEAPVVRVSQSVETGRLNLAGLVGVDGPHVSRPGVRRLPEIETRRGSIEIGEHGAGVYTVLERVPLDGRLVARSGERPGYRLEVRQAGAPEGARIELEGEATREGVELTLAGLRLDTWGPESVPSRLRAFYRRLEISGEIEPTVLRISRGGDLRVSFVLAGVDVNLPFDAPRAGEGDDTPVRLTGTRGTVEVSREGVEADLRGEVDGLPYDVGLRYDGLDLESPFDCTLVSDFRLEERMRLLLFAPAIVEERLGTFSNPTADVRATTRFWRDEAGGEIGVEGRIDFENGTAAFDGFPYRFHGLHGTFAFTRDRLDVVEVHGTAPSGAVLEATGTISPLGPDAEVDIRVGVVDVPIDAVLLDAMEENGRALVDALFDRERYAELVRRGLVVDAGERAALEDEAARLREEMAAWVGGGIADAERERVRDRLDELSGLLVAPGFAFGASVGVGVRVRRELGLESIWSTDVRVTMPRAGLVPSAFPIPLVARDVELRIDDRVARLTGGEYRALGGGRALIEAEVPMREGEDASPTVRIEAEGVVIDPRLRHAVTAPRGGGDAAGMAVLEEMLARLNLEGRLDCGAVIGAREDGSLGYDVDVRVEGVDARPMALDAAEGEGRLRLGGLRGRIHVDERRVSLDLEGEASARLDRESGGASEATSDVALVASFDLGASEVQGRATARRLDVDMPVEDAVAVVSEDAARGIVLLRERYGADGVLGVTATVAGPFGGDTDLSVSIDEIGTLAFRAFEERVRLGSSEGRATVSLGERAEARFDGFAAPLFVGGEPSGELWVDGVLALAREGDGAGLDGGAGPDAGMDAWAEGAQVRAVLDGLRLESTLVRRLLTDRIDGWEDVRDRYRPSGTLTIDLEAVRDPAPEDGGEPGEPREGAEGVAGVTVAPLLYRASIEPSELRVETGAGRLAMRSMEGRVLVDGRRGRVEGLRASGEGWSASADGGWETDEAGGYGVTLDVGYEGERVPDEVRAVLPQGWRGLLDQFEVRAPGPVRIEGARVGVTREGRGSGAGVFTRGVIEFEDAGAQVGVPLTDVDGRLRFEAGTGDGGTAFRLELEAARFRMSGVRMTDGRAVVMSGREPGVVLAPEVTADCHGGRLAASVQVRPEGWEGSSSRFWVDAVLSAVRTAPLLEDFAAAGGPAAGEPTAWEVADDRSRGVLSANMSVSGLLGDPGSMRGRGSLRVTGGPVVALPLLLPLIEFSNLQAPVGDELQQAQGTFFVTGDVLTFEDLSVLSSSVEIFGYGTMSWPGTELDLRFHSRARRRIPLVSVLLEGIRDELITTRVTGRAAEPDIRAEQFTMTRRLFAAMFGQAESEPERRLREVERRAREGRDRAVAGSERSVGRAVEPTEEGDG